MSNLIIIEFRDYNENYSKTGYQNKQTNFHNFTDPKAWLHKELQKVNNKKKYRMIVRE